MARKNTHGKKRTIARKTRRSRAEHLPVPAKPSKLLQGGTDTRGDRSDFYIVGIGASAGGLEAFEQFFKHMPVDSGLAFVLIPHLSPEHKSMLPELLRRYTQMETVQVEGNMKVNPNRVYIIPPNKDLAISKGILSLEMPTEQRGIRHPIDYFFRSLAIDKGERAICVILSGTGSEGALGLRAIKGEGGLVLVQDPKEAKYNGMPESAIATGLVDHVLPAEKIPELLLRYTKTAAVRGTTPPIPPEMRPPEALNRIFTLIRAQTGHDFSLYKQNTVIRRINKRMAIHQIESLEDYVSFLRGNTHEIDVLFTELLIRVTSFFRDAEAFSSFKSNVLPLLFKTKPTDNSIRIWVPGCCTGEEAYSLAILCHEFRKETKGSQKIQVFATDIDAGAIDIARAGVYSDSITEDVSAERLSRYFIKKTDAFKVKDEIRELVVFAAQDLIKDPPFSRLDLICCRNVLIYMGPVLQKKVLALFHYALGPERFLFLGSSESIGDASDLFATIDKRWKIYKTRRVETLTPAVIDLRYTARAHEKERNADNKFDIYSAAKPTVEDFTERYVLEHYGPPYVVVNEKGNILFFHGRTGKYLEPASGKAAFNIFDMAREGIRLEIRTGLRKALADKKDYSYPSLEVKTDGGYRPVNIDIKYIDKPEHLHGLIMIVFREKSAASDEKVKKVAVRRVKEDSQRQADLEYELKSTKEHLQTTIEELETSNEELKSTNEELQSSNEELQSANEELETSREELQSTNEELLTVNTELQHKIEQLSEANSDIVNLLASTQIATLFLSYDLRIRRFTPSSSEVINIIQSDVGRPISDISLKIDYPNLQGDIEDVLRTLTPRDRACRHQDGRSFLVRIAPYRTVDNLIDGAVMTLVDISDQKRARTLGDNMLACIDGIIDTVKMPILMLTTGLRFISANNAFFEKFNPGRKDIEGKSIFELAGGQWNFPAFRKLLSNIVEKEQTLENYPLEYDFPGIGRKKLVVNARRISQGDVKTETIFLAIEDVTGK